MSKHIYIYSPSSAVRDKAAFRRGVRRLQALGHHVEVDADALRSHMRFAGDDDTRLAAISRAAASGADVALISRGGYGLTRILDRLPFDAIARSSAAGMHWVGLSDFTALQMAHLAHAMRTGQMGPGAVTWAGPALGEDFGADPKQGTPEDPLPDDIMEACFDDLLAGHSEGTGWRLAAPDLANWHGHRTPEQIADLETTETIANIQYQSSGEAVFDIKNAVLWGGNLTVLTSLVGTPWLPDVRDGILFLEDVNEHPYRVERMLTQLLHAGILQRQRAVLLGQFTQYKPAVGHDRGFKFSTVVQWLRDRLAQAGQHTLPDGAARGVPVLTNLPFGHVPTKVLLPVGRAVDMEVRGRDALLFWE